MLAEESYNNYIYLRKTSSEVHSRLADRGLRKFSYLYHALLSEFHKLWISLSL